jgi:hypothetical protein
MTRWAGALLLILLIIETTIKANQGILPEMLWACYPATLLLAIGLLFDVALLSATGFLFHICIGLPSDLLYLNTNGDNNWASFLIHFLSPVIGFWAWHGKQLPFASSIIAACLFISFAIIAYFFTAPELNINQVFKPWKPVVFLGLWGSRLLNFVLLFFLLFIGRMGINRCLIKLVAQ